MQKIKNVQIRDKSFTLKELPMRAVWELLNGGQPAADAVKMVDRCGELLRLACPELTLDALLDLYPSEIEQLWHAFEEVNAAFLGLIRRIGLIDILIDSFKPVLAAEFNKALPISTGLSVHSSPGATAQSSGTTDTASS